MKNNQFHIPFIQSMLLIGAFTLVSMGISKIIVERYLFPTHPTPVFTSAPSYNEANAGENQTIRSNYRLIELKFTYYLRPW